MDCDLAWPAPCEQLCKSLPGTLGAIVRQCAKERRTEGRDGAVKYDDWGLAHSRWAIRPSGG